MEAMSDGSTSVSTIMVRNLEVFLFYETYLEKDDNFKVGNNDEMKSFNV